MKRTLGTLIYVVTVVFLTVSYTSAQEKVRTIEHGLYRQYDINTEPIAIVSREIGDRPFMDEKRGVGSSDWLRHLILGVKNISDKTIKDFTIDIVIPKQNQMAANYVMMVRFPTASEPVMDGHSVPTKTLSAAQVLKPGEIVKLKIDKSQLQMLDKIKMDGLNDIERVSVRFQNVTFHDGIRWSQGIELKEDPNLPGQWHPIRSEKKPQYVRDKSFEGSVFPFAFIHTVMWSGEQLMNISPVKSRFSFVDESDYLTWTASLTPEGCGWRDDTFETNCATSGEGACTAQVGTCVYDKDRIYNDDLGFGTFGQVLTEEGFWCRPATGEPPDACNIGVGDCQMFTKQRWYNFPTCGKPQGCAQTAIWGCIDGFVDIDGVCQRSLEYQNECTAGYDALLCECKPPPPSPSPTPTPGGGDGGNECPCGDCEYGCGGCDCGDCVNGCGPYCDWVIIEGQCYAGTEYCWWEEDTYGIWWEVCAGDPPYCDPDQTVWVCY